MNYELRVKQSPGDGMVDMRHLKCRGLNSRASSTLASGSEPALRTPRRCTFCFVYIK